MSLLEITGLSHTFGEKILYKDASICLYKGEHMGVVGQNGAGKSTLLRILTGEVIADAGQIKWQPGVRIGALNQYAQVDGAYTVRDYLKTAFDSLYEMEKEMILLYETGAEGDEQALHRASDLQERLDAMGFYEVEGNIGKVSTGLGIDTFGMDTFLETLSGGQRAKVILAKLLLEKADVLLLDEPTNFLDREHVSWLSDYLASFEGAFVIVSHDFTFLERITDCICDVEFQAIKKYHGSYSEFVRQKKERREQYMRKYQAQQREIARTEAYIRKNKAGVNAKMARGRQKQLDRMQRLAPPGFTSRPTIAFTELPVSQGKALEAQDLEIGYKSILLSPINLSVASGEKVVITGFNGIGKSTLLKTLVGEIPPLGGQFCFGDTVKIGYYEQELVWERTNQTPVQIVQEVYPHMTEKEIRKKLAQCGVKADSVRQEIGTLSGGEQSKVKLCRLLLTPVNCLILDEPTNHLDEETKQVLQDALSHFSGSILLVSHEERFYREFAEKIVSVKPADVHRIGANV
jgi:ATPase subunit of ABC transporter with duplicated ATPase domains